MGCNIFSTLAEEKMERDLFMSPNDAREFGLIDTILEHPPSLEEEKSQKNS